MRALNGTRQVFEAFDAVEAALEVDGTVSKDALHHRDRLGQPIDPDGAGIVCDARAVVLRLVPAGANSDLEPSVAEPVQRGQLLGEDDRMAEVVVENECPQPQGRRDSRRQARAKIGPNWSTR